MILKQKIEVSLAWFCMAVWSESLSHEDVGQKEIGESDGSVHDERIYFSAVSFIDRQTTAMHLKLGSNNAALSHENHLKVGACMSEFPTTICFQN